MHRSRLALVVDELQALIAATARWARVAVVALVAVVAAVAGCSSGETARPASAAAPVATAAATAAAASAADSAQTPGETGAEAPTPGGPAWVQLLTHEQRRATAFYAHLFHWTTRPHRWQSSTVPILARAGQPFGRIWPLEDVDGPTSEWACFWPVPDIGSAAQAARAAGGRTMVEPYDLLGLGPTAVVGDASDHAVPIMAPAGADGETSGERGQTGEGQTGEGQVAFCESLSAEPAETARFLAAVTGYTADQPDGIHHQVLLRAGAQVRAVVSLRGRKSARGWMPYVRVTDVDRTASRARKLGGAILAPPTNRAGLGRVAVLADPAGAAFGVVEL